MQTFARTESTQFAESAQQTSTSTQRTLRTTVVSQSVGEECSPQESQHVVQEILVCNVQQIIPNARSVILYQPNRTCTRRGVSTLPAFRASSESTLLTTQFLDVSIKAATSVSKTSRFAQIATLREAPNSLMGFAFWR